jgi:protein gp37
MSEFTKIEWATHSWSLWRGCTKVSPGCANCYAEKLSLRNPKVLGEWGRGRPRAHAKDHKKPTGWNRKAHLSMRCLNGHHFFAKPGNLDSFCPECDCPEAKHHVQTVFPSLCDWLDEEVPVSWLAEWLELIHATPNLRWLMLTKRPENWRQRLELVIEHLDETDTDASKTGGLYVFVQNWLGNMGGTPGFRPPNIWVGTSVEDQPRADQRIPELLRIPAVGRFLSVEPLLGPVDLAASVKAKEACPRCTPPTDPGCPYCLGTGGVPIFHNGAIHWVIIGGESGPGARQCNLDWIRSLVRQCKDASVPPFVKQWGSNPVEDVNPPTGTGFRLPVLAHPKGGDPAEWPMDVRVREFPEGLR